MIKHYTAVTEAEWPSRYFSPREIACRGTGLVLLDKHSIAALKMLDALREEMGHPLICNSGYRSPQHNKAVGGARGSYHMRGIAFDISMDNVDPHKFEAAARKVGFTGIGLYPPQKPHGAKGFIHIDTRVALGAGPWRGAQWGEFPDRGNRFGTEPVATPIRDTVQDVAPTVAGGSVLIEFAAGAEPIIREVAPKLPDDWQALAYGALAVIGLLLVLRSVRSRRQKGEGA